MLWRSWKIDTAGQATDIMLWSRDGRIFMKNKIWKRIRRTGITALAAGAVLGAGFWPETVKSADLTDDKLSIGQVGSWLDMKNGKAELEICVEGLGSWIRQREAVKDEADRVKYREQEREEEYEYMEELAPGEAVQQENEEQEETGESPQEGETAAGEAVEEIIEEAAEGITEEYEGTAEGRVLDIADKEIPVQEEAQQKLTLVTYISEYFLPETEELPGDISATAITIKNKKGESTEITKLECEIGTEELLEGAFSLRIPLTLREEYRYPAEASSYSLVQDEPLEKDRSGAGTFLLMEEDGETGLLAEGISPSLEIEAAQAEMNLALTSETKEMKAGKTICYRIDLTNTGKLDLTDIHLTSTFSCPKIVQRWENGEGLNTGDFSTKGAKAQIFTLKAGESRTLYVLAPLENEQEKPLEHKIEAAATVKDKPDAAITRTVSVTDKLQALKADFTVKKTADKEKAEPGENVTYQICIVNTGEKTLHSVVGTERFQAEGIQAQFVEQEGITLNSTKTKALIQKIAPGEAVSLRAVVKIPEKAVNRKLLNQVTVTSQETGERIVEASAQIAVEGAAVTATPTGGEEVSQTEGTSEEQDNAALQDDSQARSVSSHPKTGDDTKTELFTLVLLTAGLTILGGFWLYRKYRG